MKWVLFFSLVSLSAVATSNKLKNEASNQFVKKEILSKDKNKSPEDCEDKAKKKVEIKPESLSLTGNAGCTLEEAH